MQDGDPAHRSRVVKKWLKDNHVPVLECPRNSPDLNPIENVWNYMKNKVHEAHEHPDIKGSPDEVVGRPQDKILVFAINHFKHYFCIYVLLIYMVKRFLLRPLY